MDIVKTLMSQFGPSIVKGIAGNLGLGSNETESALGSVIPTLLGGMTDKVGSSAGAEELFKTLGGSDFSGGLLDNLGSAFSGDSGSSLLKTGASLLPMLLGGQSKSSALIDIAGKLLGVGSGKSKSLMSLAAPVLLNFLGKKVLGDGLNVGGLKDLILGQKEYIGGRIPSEISKEMGWSNWSKASTGHSSSSSSSSASRTATTSSTAQTSKGGGGMKWLWPLLLLGLLGFLGWSLMKGCNTGDKHHDATHKEQVHKHDGKKGHDHTKGSHDHSHSGTKTNTTTNAGTTTQASGTTTTTSTTSTGTAASTATGAATAASGSAEPPAAGTTAGETEASTTATYTGVASQFNIAAKSGTGVINFGNVSPDGKALSAGARATFDQVAAIMKANPSMNIEVRGHNADKGGAGKNTAARGASKVRAGLVQAYLITKGIKGSRIKTASKGHDEPIAGKEANDEGNKRISIAIQ